MPNERDNSYNGWPNKSTWGVQLRISNSPGWYHYWRSQAVQCIEEFDDGATDALADRMAMELRGMDFSEVEDWNAVYWHRIASSWVEEEREAMERDA